jgi:hypothetical protein
VGCSQWTERHLRRNLDKPPPEMGYAGFVPDFFSWNLTDQVPLAVSKTGIPISSRDILYSP